MTPKPLPLSREEMNRAYLLSDVLKHLHNAMHSFADPFTSKAPSDTTYYDAILEVAEEISTEHHALLNRFTIPDDEGGAA